MSLDRRYLSRLFPLAGAFALSLVLSTAAQAQAPASSPAAAASAQDVPLTAAERQQLVGTYVLKMPGMPDRSMPFRVYEEQGVLYGQPQGGAAKRMLHQGKHQFRADGEAVALVTFTSEGGKVTRVSVVTPEGSLEGTRETEVAR